MTNGEMIKKLFPQLQIMADSGDKYALKGNAQPYFAIEVDKGWWKDEYTTNAVNDN